MAKRNRTNSVQFYLSDDEQYILNTKFKASGMKSMSAFLRKLILYGYVYNVDYSYLRNYNTELGRISSSLNQIAKRVNSTGNIYQDDIDEVKEFLCLIICHRLPPFLHDKRQPIMDCLNKRTSSKSFTDLLLNSCNIYLLLTPLQTPSS